MKENFDNTPSNLSNPRTCQYEDILHNIFSTSWFN